MNTYEMCCFVHHNGIPDLTTTASSQCPARYCMTSPVRASRLMLDAPATQQKLGLWKNILFSCHDPEICNYKKKTLYIWLTMPVEIWVGFHASRWPLQSGCWEYTCFAQSQWMTACVHFGDGSARNPFSFVWMKFQPHVKERLSNNIFHIDLITSCTRGALHHVLSRGRHAHQIKPVLHSPEPRTRDWK